MLSTLLRLGLPSGLFPSGFPKGRLFYLKKKVRGCVFCVSFRESCTIIRAFTTANRRVITELAKQRVRTEIIKITY